MGTQDHSLPSLSKLILGRFFHHRSRGHVKTYFQSLQNRKGRLAPSLYVSVLSIFLAGHFVACKAWANRPMHRNNCDVFLIFD